MLEIEFYETEEGSCPVKEFLDELPLKLGAKAVRDIELLEEKGTQLREPYSKHLRNGIFELRTQFSNDIVRVFYFFYIGQKAILTNGFIKKTQKTPEREIEKAVLYKADYERRQEQR